MLSLLFVRYLYFMLKFKREAVVTKKSLIYRKQTSRKRLLHAVSSFACRVNKEISLLTKGVHVLLTDLL